MLLPSDSMPEARSLPPRFLVIGCGGIGGVVTGALASSGQDVTAVTTNTDIFSAVMARGLTLLGEGGAVTIRARVELGVPDGGERFDYVVLATQPPQVEEAARSAAAVLAPTGAMICLQNGLCEDRVAKIVGHDRVIGGVVAWGATMPEPGCYERTSAGGFTLGRMDGSALGAFHDPLVHALEAVGAVETTGNLRGKRWSKLAINCAISSLGTIGGDRLGALMHHRFVRRLALELMTEVTEVAHREGVRLEKVSGTLDLSWIALDEAERESAGSPSLVAKHALLLAVGFRYRRMKSSMLSAIERGRPPAVDFLNGEVASRARSHGIRVPVNDCVRETVWAIARGEKPSGLATLRELYAATGSHGA